MNWPGNLIRDRFIEFFESKGHKWHPSASLVPRQDPTVLLTTAGMLPFKPVFMGVEPAPEPPRAVTIQKCFRTTDLDLVGRTARHHTFFQMLGNFSFGDYFKAEAIAHAWEFLTGWLQIDQSKLWISVYESDDEAIAIWRDQIGVPADRIVRMGADSNFWAAGPTGPCGPCSEIYFDLGPDAGNGNPEAILGEDDDRYLEIWNLVFMEFNRDEAGNLSPLPAKNIDTGMGLERIASVMQGVSSNFDTDLVKPIVDQIQAIAGLPGIVTGEPRVSLRLMADHLRGATFLVGDGVVPTNEGRGYVLRRIIRRAIRHARLLGIRRPFVREVAEAIIERYGYYPELAAQRAHILEVLAAEEARFGQTIDRGTQLLQTAFDALQGKSTVLTGTTAFELYDTYGFPLELTMELARELGFTVDEAGFHTCMEEQRERARQAREEAGVTFQAMELRHQERTDFVGYQNLSCPATVREVLVDPQGRTGVVLGSTPFYAESGGQVGDQGWLGEAAVVDVQKQGDVIVHLLAEGARAPEIGSTLEARVDVARREATMRHHTATHLLHAALKQVLGDQVHQAGSLVGPGELRFDFSFVRAMTPEELERVENLVNAQILANRGVAHLEMSIARAREEGAMALFGEKYGEVVRVIDVPGFSKELCGGTHVTSTGSIGAFKIVREEGIASGVRRIQAVAGAAAIDLVRDRFRVLERACETLKASPDDLSDRLERLQDRVKESDHMVRELRTQLAIARTSALADRVESLGTCQLLVQQVQDLEPEALRAAAENLLARFDRGLVVLASATGGRVALVAAVSPSLVSEGAHAGKLVSQVLGKIGGKGGGKPQLAQGGGGDVEALPSALGEASTILREQLKVSV